MSSGRRGSIVYAPRKSNDKLIGLTMPHAHATRPSKLFFKINTRRDAGFTPVLRKPKMHAPFKPEINE